MSHWASRALATAQAHTLAHPVGPSAWHPHAGTTPRRPRISPSIRVGARATALVDFQRGIRQDLGAHELQTQLASTATSQCTPSRTLLFHPCMPQPRLRARVAQRCAEALGPSGSIRSPIGWTTSRAANSKWQTPSMNTHQGVDVHRACVLVVQVVQPW